MKVLIIEDEKPAARRLSRLLQAYEMHVMDMLHSVEESLTWFSTHEHPDLIFLDIQLSDGLSFEIFETIEVQSAIIFTTAYDEYALKAFKLNSIDYLLKPIDEEELQNAVDKYKNRVIPKETIAFDFNEIKNLLINPVERSYKKRFTVKVGQHIKMIVIDDIECIYSENKGSYLHTNQGRDYLIDATLEQLQNDLAPEKFFRVNRKFYVHINAIKDIISYTNSRLQLKLNTFKEEDIIVSRERVRDFKDWLE